MPFNMRSVLALFLILASFVSAQSTQPPVCAEGVQIIAVVGSNVPNGSYGLTKTFVQGVLTDIPNSANISLDYNRFHLLNQSAARFIPEVIQGVPLLYESIVSHTTACPNTPIVLHGYSEGAVVVMNLLCGASSGWFPVTEPLSSSFTSSIIAVVLYGDESRTASQSYNYGTCESSGPHLARRNPGGCSAFAPAIQSYCLDNDIDCCGTANASAPWPYGINPHYLYPPTYDNSAVAFVHAQHQNYLSRPLTTSSTPATSTFLGAIDASRTTSSVPTSTFSSFSSTSTVLASSSSSSSKSSTRPTSTQSTFSSTRTSTIPSSSSSSSSKSSTISTFTRSSFSSTSTSTTAPSSSSSTSKSSTVSTFTHPSFSSTSTVPASSSPSSSKSSTVSSFTRPSFSSTSSVPVSTSASSKSSSVSVSTSSSSKSSSVPISISSSVKPSTLPATTSSSSSKSSSHPASIPSPSSSTPAIPSSTPSSVSKSSTIPSFTPSSFSKPSTIPSSTPSSFSKPTTPSHTTSASSISLVTFTKTKTTTRTRPVMAAQATCTMDKCLSSWAAHPTKASRYCSSLTGGLVKPTRTPFPKVCAGDYASRVSSACACLIFPTPTAATTVTDNVLNKKKKKHHQLHGGRAHRNKNASPRGL